MADQWFSFFPGDYLRDTRGLSLAEHGAYFLLLSELYVRNGEPLPANAKQLHTICSAFAKAEKAAVDTVIRRYFEKVDGGYIQGRAMDEIARRQEISKKRAVAGSKSRASVKQLQPAIDKQLHTPPHPPLESSLREDSPALDLSLPPEDQEQELLRQKELDGKTPGALAFEAYARAYKTRHGTDPVRNAKVNAQFVQLVKRLGPDAAEVAAFYPTHNSALYVRSTHAVDLLLRDCEALRTQWATGRRTTETGARQADRTGTMAQHAHDLIEEQRRDRH